MGPYEITGYDYDDYRALLQQVSGESVGATTPAANSLVRFSPAALSALRRPTAAVAAPAMAMAPAPAPPPPQGQYGQALGLISRTPNQYRRYWLGFATNAVAANAVFISSAQPQVIFRPERFVVPAPNNEFFDILDVKVGKDSQLAAAGAVASATFAADSVDSAVQWDTASVSQVISIQAQNTDAAGPHNFRATVIGTTLQ